LVLIGVTVAVLLGLSFYGYTRAMDYDAQAQARASLARMQERLHAHLRSQARAADELARLWSSGLLDTARSGDLETALRALAPTEGSFRSLGVMQPDGLGVDIGPTAADLLETEECRPERGISRCRASYWTRAGQLERAEDWRDAAYRDPDPATRPWFRAAVERGSGAWSEPFVIAADGAYSHRFRMTYGVPAARGGSAIGVVEVAVSLDEMLADVESMQPSAACLTFITDSTGRPVLLPPRPEFKGMEATPAGRPVGQDFLPLVKDVLDAAAAGSTVSIDGERYYVATAHFASEPGVPWRISMALPSRELLGGPRRLAFVMLGLAVLALAFVAWRAMWLARRFAEPLRALAASSERATRGEDFEPPATDIAEIGDLGARFKEASTAIRDRARLESELRHAQRVATLGALAGGIAHDVNNQLAAILGQIELAKRRAPAAAVAELDLAKEAVMSCAELVRGLLAFSRRGGQGQKGPVDVNDVIERAARLLGGTLGGARIDMIMHLSPGLPPVIGDRVLLEQVVMNLAVNARDAMPDGGTITLASGSRDPQTVYFSVTDTGTGIAPEAREHIFEPFFTTKEPGQGTGLGLTIIQGIVAAHNGRIEIDSVRGRGSTFTVLLGAAPAGVRSSQRTPAARAS
jgi:signal transduction histidine kinase